MPEYDSGTTGSRKQKKVRIGNFE
jgi:parvin